MTADWERDDAEIAAEHPLHDPLVEARRLSKPELLLTALRDRYRVSALAPSIVAYVTETLSAARLPGPFHVVGVAEASARPTTCARVFGRFGERTFPALAVGGDGAGTTFWAVLQSGAVISLHHDATFYEVAAASAGDDLERALGVFQHRGSALGLERLLALQRRVHAVLGDSCREPVPVYARAALDALGLTPAKARRELETSPFEFLGLRASDLDDLPKKGAASAPKKRTRARAPHPRLARLLDAADVVTELDLAGLLLERLPAELTSFVNLGRLDLSHDRKLDFEEAFERLAALPKLEEVRFRNLGMKALPASFARLTHVRRVDLTGWAPGVRGDNGFDTTQVLEVLEALPELREIELLGAIDAGGRAGELLARPNFSGLEALSTLQRGITPRGYVMQPLPASLFALSHLRRLHLKDAELGDPAIGESFSKLGRLQELSLEGFDGPTDLAFLGGLELSHLSLEKSRTLVSLDGLRGDSLQSLSLAELSNLAPTRFDGWVALEELRLRRGLVFGELPALPGNLRRLRVGEPFGEVKLDSIGKSLRGVPELEVLALYLGDASIPRIPGLSELRRLRVLEVPSRVELEGPCPALEKLSFSGRTPDWIEGCTSLREVVVNGAGEGATTLRRLLALPALESLDVTMFGGAVDVPDAFGAARQLRTLRLAGEWSDDSKTLERALRAPALHDLELFSFAIQELPAAIEKLPLRRFAYYPPSKGTRLDLATAFRRLSRTSLRVLELWNVAELPDEIALLESLESLAIKSVPFPRLPDSIAKLTKLRRIEFPRDRLAGPLRKRIDKLLPACAVFDSIW